MQKADIGGWLISTEKQMQKATVLLFLPRAGDTDLEVAMMMYGYDRLDRWSAIGMLLRGMLTITTVMRKMGYGMITYVPVRASLPPPQQRR